MIFGCGGAPHFLNTCNELFFKEHFFCDAGASYCKFLDALFIDMAF